MAALLLSCASEPVADDVADGAAPDTVSADTGLVDTAEGDGSTGDVPELPELIDLIDLAGDARRDAEDGDRAPERDSPSPDDGASDGSGGEVGDVAPPAPWRSALYPEDWAPGFADDEGRFIHDFSYAGYHNSDEPLPSFSGDDFVRFDVVADFAADPSGESDATAAIQAAIDAAEANAGGVVYFPAGLYRCDGLLTVDSGGVWLRGEGAEASRIWFTRSEGMSFRSHLTFGRRPAEGDDYPLITDVATWDTELEIADATGIAVGDDVVVGWTITPEFIADHGMTETWRAFNDSWQPFFWRTVVAVDGDATPQRVTLDVPLRYPGLVRDAVSIRTVSGTLHECGVADLGFANAVAWDDAWAVDQVHFLELSGVADCAVSGVATFVPPGDFSGDAVTDPHVQSGGILVRYSKRVTVQDSVVENAQNRGGGGNGYLFEVRQSSEVLFARDTGRNGRHNFIQNWGFGATGIVWTATRSEGGVAALTADFPLGGPGLSEFHHSLATANLIEASYADDGWGAVNRGDYSTGAGHSATESVFWGVEGPGALHSAQYGWGYVIGTGEDTPVNVFLDGNARVGTEPSDWIEGEGSGATLEPASLWFDQRARRWAREGR